MQRPGKYYRLIWAFAIALTLIVSVVLIAQGGGGKKSGRTIGRDLSPDYTVAENFTPPVPSDWSYPEAVNPDTTRGAFLKSRDLWPDIGNPHPDDAHRERVRAEWREFAAKHPENIFIPAELRKSDAARSEAVRRDNDLAGDYAARQATLVHAAKYSTPGTNPTAESATPPDPKEQRAWLEYKIRETRSVIEVMDYFLQKGSPDAQQIANGQSDKVRLQKDLSGYESALAQVP